SFGEIQQVFQQTTQLDVLGGILEQVDLRNLNGSFELTQLLSVLLKDSKNRPLGLRLFKKTWQTLPESRTMLLGGFNNDAIWQQPEIYEYARQLVLPGETTNS